MTKVKSLLMAAVAAAPLLTFSAQPASALFGLVCIPTLHNCMCTFIKPCPVVDFQKNARIELQNSKLKDALKVMEGVQGNASALTKGLMGQNFFSGLPGIDAIGIDLNGLDISNIVNGNLSSLGLQGLDGLNVDLGGLNPQALMSGDLTSLANSLGVNPLEKFGIDAGNIDIQGIVNGDLSSLGTAAMQSMNLDLQGLDVTALARGDLSSLTSALSVPALESIGIDPSQINIAALASGDIRALSGFLPPEITGLASKLTDLGISADTLDSLIEGNLNPSDFMQIAGAAGVNFSELEQFGLSQDVIGSLASGEMSPAAVLDLSRRLGVQGEALSNMGITPELIQNVAAGRIDAGAILHVAQNAGLDMAQLRSVGLDENTITALAGGAGPEAVMSILQSAGFDNSPISALGIDAGMLGQIASGQLPPDAIATLLQGTGIDPSALVIPGIDGPIRLDGTRIQSPLDMITFPTTQIPGFDNALSQARELQDLAGKIQALPQELQGQVLGQLQTLQTQIQGQLQGQISQLQGQLLGPLEGQLSQLQGQLTALTGNLPINGDIVGLLKGNGIDLNGILGGDISQIAGQLDSAISNVSQGLGMLGGNAAGALGQVSNLSGALSNLPNGGEGISRALGGMGGLNGLLGGSYSSGIGKGGMAGLIGKGQSEDPICQADLDLISISHPPNPYGDDMATIDMAIAGGSVEAMEESNADAVNASKETATWGFARAIVARPLMEHAYESYGAMQEMVDNSGSQTEDWAINATIRGHLQTARAENAAMMTYVLSAKAARVLQGPVLSAVPILPQDSQFSDQIETGYTERREINRAAIEARSEAIGVYSDNLSDARTAVQDHNLQVAVNNIQSTLPDTLAVIQRHEDYKDQLVALEEVIKNGLDDLYVGGSEATWEPLRQQLYASAGSFYDPSKWQSGYATATSISDAVVAPVAQTAYGQRKIEGVAYDRDGERPVYSTTTQTPYSYPAIDSHPNNAGLPFDVIANLNGGGEGGDEITDSELVGVIQYYLETKRRMDDSANDRRSNAGGVSMTSVFWNEMINNAPSCISGPFQLTAPAVRTRPEMFDLDPGCTHIVWEGGDEEDYIPGGQLGGADHALWNAKLTQAQVAAETGGASAVADRIDQVISSLSGVIGTIDAGAPEYTQHARDILSVLQQVKADTSFSTDFEIPDRR